MTSAKVINQKLHVGDKWFEIGETVELEGAALENLIAKNRVEIIPELVPETPFEGTKEEKSEPE